MDSEQRFIASLQATKNGGFRIELPFNPNDAWSNKDRHHVTGTINRIKVRGALQADNGAYILALGPAWCRDAALQPEMSVEVVLAPEGPQQQALADDITKALMAEPAAAAFFDALPTFYRKGYLRWIDATKRSPEERTNRISQLIELLKAGKKQR